MLAAILVFAGLNELAFAAEKEAAAPAKKAAPAAKEEPAEKPAAEKKEEKVPEKEAAKAPELHLIENGPIKVTTSIPGIVESHTSTPLAMDLLQWADLLVVKSVPHGTVVKEGQVLVELDSKALKVKVAELEDSLPLKKLELEIAEATFDKLEKTTPVELDKSRRGRMQAEEDFAYFEDVTRPMREKDAKQDVKSIADNLSYAEEELKQLKKMYEADDLTEETEEIILRRTQNTVNAYRWMLEKAEERSKRTLNTTIPREHEALVTSLKERQMAWRASEKALPDALQKAKLELENKKKAHVELEKSLKEHRADLKALVVRAPHDGIVYYGMSQRGKWTTAATVERKLLPGGKLTMREVFMTVVDPEKLKLTLAIPEESLGMLDRNQAAVITFKSFPDSEINAKVTGVSPIPYADNTFDGEILFKAPGDEMTLYPGMKADAEVTVYEKADAVLVPKKAVKEEEGKEMVMLKGGVKRVIETGHSDGDMLEVEKGLKAGDAVVLEKPEPKEEKK